MGPWGPRITGDAAVTLHTASFYLLNIHSDKDARKKGGNCFKGGKKPKEYSISLNKGKEYGTVSHANSLYLQAYH